jgi:hypothetical protein
MIIYIIEIAVPLIAFVSGAIVLIRKGEIGKLKTILLRLCLEAEKEFGGGTGTIKFADVVSKIYPMIPDIIKPFITQATLSKLVDAALVTLRKQLETTAKVARIIVGE